MAKNIVILVVCIGLGYFIRAYTEKPKIIEVPKDRVITKTQYVDKVTKQIVTVESEVIKYDTSAAVQIAKQSNKQNLSVAYGIDTSELNLPVYGVQYSYKLIGDWTVGISAYTNSAVFVTVGKSF
jgi:hypothetical protein